jgi:hypothetical protein
LLLFLKDEPFFTFSAGVFAAHQHKLARDRD